MTIKAITTLVQLGTYNTANARRAVAPSHALVIFISRRHPAGHGMGHASQLGYSRNLVAGLRVEREKAIRMKPLRSPDFMP
jgi:hypothetical protein